jgi:hypothetical protein
MGLLAHLLYLYLAVRQSRQTSRRIENRCQSLVLVFIDGCHDFGPLVAAIRVPVHMDNDKAPS